MYSCLSNSRWIPSEVFQTNCSSCVHHAFTVHLALPFALGRVLRAFIVLNQSPSSVQLSLNRSLITVRSAFTIRSECVHRSRGKVERFNVCLIILRSCDFYLPKLIQNKLSQNVYIFNFMIKQHKGKYLFRKIYNCCKAFLTLYKKDFSPNTIT